MIANTNSGIKIGIFFGTSAMLAIVKQTIDVYKRQELCIVKHKIQQLGPYMQWLTQLMQICTVYFQERRKKYDFYKIGRAHV